MVSEVLPQPGWYADPANRPGQRWWDGRAWTAHTRETPPPPAPLRSRSERLRRLVGYVAVVLAAASATVFVLSAVVLRPAPQNLATVDGTVTNVTSSTESTGVVSYTVVVRFTDLATKPHDLVVTYGTEGHPLPGSVVLVEFDPMNPLSAAIANPPSGVWWMPSAVSGVALGLSSMAAFRLLRRKTRPV